MTRSITRKKLLLWWPMAPHGLIAELQAGGYDIVGIIEQKSDQVPMFRVMDLFDLGDYDEYRYRPWYRSLFTDCFAHYYKNISRVSVAQTPKHAFFRKPNYFEPSYYAYDEVANRFFLHASRLDQLLEHTGADAVWFSRAPHLGLDNLMFEIARRKGLQTLVVQQTIIPDKFFYGRDTSELFAHAQASALAFEPYRVSNERDLDLFYMKARRDRDRERNYKLFRAIRKRRFKFTAAWRLHTLLVKRNRLLAAALFYYLFHRSRRKLLDQIRNRERVRQFSEQPTGQLTVATLPARFVYFPLHLEPEATTSEFGGAYKDQIDAIEAMSAALPENWILVLKENPKQTFFYRSPEFHARIAANPHIQWAAPTENSIALIERCRFVATITGTAGYEAIARGKPVVHFGNAWYASITGAFEFESMPSPDQVAEFTIPRGQLRQDIEALLSHAADGVIYSQFQAISKRSPKQNVQMAVRSLMAIDQLLHGGNDACVGGATEASGHVSTGASV